MFPEIFKETISAYADSALAATLTMEIQQHYSEEGRYYHNIQHLDNLLNELLPLKEHIRNWEVMICAIGYHDIIYNVSGQDNEEKSANVATERLLQTTFSAENIELCREYVLATKSHAIHSNPDINYFTDADLSVLGAKSNTYVQYAQQIRQEYKIYPDDLYNPGRRKVLRHFLDMKHIFKTNYFSEKYEQQARINLQAELEMIAG